MIYETTMVVLVILKAVLVILKAVLVILKAVLVILKAVLVILKAVSLQIITHLSILFNCTFVKWIISIHTADGSTTGV
jgi:glyoxylate utilization-related uncharacterized protein